MKNKKIWYLGYVIAICSFIAIFAFELSEGLKVVLTLIFAISLSITYVKLMHSKMIKTDKSYRINVNDERNEKIRDKVNATMASILMILMGVIAIVCIYIKAYLPAILLAASVFLSPIIMYFINIYYEKKF